MITRNKLKYIGSSFIGKNIAVIGDLMLDGYFWGDVSRVSPEAPVPVVEIDNEFFRFGGAANVALNIQKLGGNPYTIGVIGDDPDGNVFNQLLENSKLNNDGIFKVSGRPTTTKTRVIAGNQHICRIDKEKKENIPSKIEKKIIDYLRNQINQLDAIILQDYNKGVLTPTLISDIIELANNNNKIICVDPKFNNFKNFKNVTVFKPNKKETEDILGIKIVTDEDIINAGNELQKILNAKYILLTLGKDGVALFQKDKKEIRIPTIARKVSDVSGAGDTVISTITQALTTGASIVESAYIANYAGGLVCEEIGIVPIALNKLMNTIEKNII